MWEPRQRGDPKTVAEGTTGMGQQVENQDRREPNSVPSDQRPLRVNLLGVAQTFAAYLALPAVLLYPFGFVALFAQFTNYFRLDFYTAW
jgi:hypothetical protein